MAETMRTRAAAALPLIAFGVITGVSFLAQPAKFLTPELTLAQLVSVGSTLFGMSHAFQLAMLLVLGAIVPFAKTRSTTAWALLGVFAVALGIQQFGLMPPLEARLVLLKQGMQPEPSALHFVYVALELVKLASLLSLAWLQPAERLLRPTSLGASS
jgi:hypothetical protein